jgi:hypothetical protein
LLFCLYIPSFQGYSRTFTDSLWTMPVTRHVALLLCPPYTLNKNLWQEFVGWAKRWRAHQALAPWWARRAAPLPTLHLEQKFMIRICRVGKAKRAHQALAPWWARRFAPLPTLHHLAICNVHIKTNCFTWYT